jgi:uncharacterized membrane protein YraQ (UPF0718 family)
MMNKKFKHELITWGIFLLAVIIIVIPVNYFCKLMGLTGIGKSFLTFVIGMLLMFGVEQICKKFGW